MAILAYWLAFSYGKLWKSVLMSYKVRILVVLLINTSSSSSSSSNSLVLSLALEYTMPLNSTQQSLSHLEAMVVPHSILKAVLVYLTRIDSYFLKSQHLVRSFRQIFSNFKLFASLIKIELVDALLSYAMNIRPRTATGSEMTMVAFCLWAEKGGPSQVDSLSRGKYVLGRLQILACNPHILSRGVWAYLANHYSSNVPATRAALWSARRSSPCRSVSSAFASHRIVSCLYPPHLSYHAAPAHRHPWTMRKGNSPKIELSPVEEIEDRETFFPRCDMECV